MYDKKKKQHIAYKKITKKGRNTAEVGDRNNEKLIREHQPKPSR
jgi:hypothetical protein